MTTDELKLIEYQSWHNGNEWTNEEISFIIKNGCSCDDCGKGVSEMWDFPMIDILKEELLCEDCYQDKYYSRCPICEDSYEKYETPETDDIYLYISKPFAKECNMENGIYKALHFPLYYGDCITGFDSFFENSMELVKKIDIESIKRYLISKDVSIDCSADFICPYCADKYLGKTYLRNDYVNKKFGMHYVINQRGFIEKGFSPIN